MSERNKIPERTGLLKFSPIVFSQLTETAKVSTEISLAFPMLKSMIELNVQIMVYLYNLLKFSYFIEQGLRGELLLLLSLAEASLILLLYGNGLTFFLTFAQTMFNYPQVLLYKSMLGGSVS